MWSIKTKKHTHTHTHTIWLQERDLILRCKYTACLVIHKSCPVLSPVDNIPCPVLQQTVSHMFLPWIYL